MENNILEKPFVSKILKQPPDWLVKLLKNPDNKLVGPGYFATWPLYWFQIFISTKCTRKCKYCYTFYKINDKIQEMDDRTLDRLCDWIPEVHNQNKWLLSMIDFLGGEPLLFTDKIKKVMDSVHKKTTGMLGVLFTNGDLLHKTNWDHLEHIQTMNLNITDISKDEIINRLSLIINGGILNQPAIVITLDDFNISRVTDIVRLSVEKYNITPKMYRNSLEGNNEDYKKLLLIKMHEVCDILEEYKNKGYKIDTTYMLDFFPPRINFKPRLCGNQIASVGPSGDISGCTKGSLNCKEAKAGTIWDDNPLNLLKIKSKDFCLDYEKPGYSKECLTCKAKFSCNGGCVYDRLITNNTLIGPYPFCQLHKEIFPRLEEIHCD